MSEHHDRLEARYERLLALFPAAYRQEYGDEMIGVLLAGAKPQQRFPGLREAADLVRCAVWQRLGGQGAGAADDRRVAAAAVFGLVTVFTMLAYRLGATGAELFSYWRYSEHLALFPMQWWLTAAGWTVAVIFSFTRFGLVAAASAWAAVLVQAATVLTGYPAWPSVLVSAWWVLVLGVSGALALTVRGRTRPQDVLGARRTVTVAAGFSVLAAVPSIEALLAEVHRYPDGGWSIGAFGGYNSPGWLGGFWASGLITVVLGGLSALVILYCLVRAGAPVRRRLIAMAAPTLAIKLVVPIVFNGFLVSTQRFDPPVLLASGQWLFLIVFPPVVFFAGTLLVERGERHAHLIELGRAAERAARLGPAAPPS
ncbi:hypothetical protein ACFQO7_00565 [Catellatospora aurea]|uniref:Uncharacterized protein n=1 Tax=Catellatospora aurea TaxID=1337874 RepID=A0ABW2GRL5_9ACTN